MRDEGKNAESVTDDTTLKGKPKKKERPGRKRVGTDVLVPVTMKIEPSELAMIETIAKASKRSRSDLMREMLSYGFEHMMEEAFGPNHKEERKEKLEEG